MTDGKKEVQVLHNWLWVIIPYSTNNVPLLSAYCKNCQATWSEVIKSPYLIEGFWESGYLSKSEMPKWGCINPMEGL